MPKRKSKCAHARLDPASLYSHQANKTLGLKYDQTVRLTGFYVAKDYPENLRRIKYYDINTDKNLVFLTNNFSLPAIIIADHYRSRWQVELFFKWIKQNLRIKSLCGTSEKPVKTPIWIAVCVYVQFAIMKKHLKLQAGLYTILQILSVTIFENTTLNQLFQDNINALDGDNVSNQLNIFNQTLGH